MSEESKQVDVEEHSINEGIDPQWDDFIKFTGGKKRTLRDQFSPLWDELSVKQKQIIEQEDQRLQSVVQHHIYDDNKRSLAVVSSTKLSDFTARDQRARRRELHRSQNDPYSLTALHYKDQSTVRSFKKQSTFKSASTKDRIHAATFESVSHQNNSASKSASREDRLEAATEQAQTAKWGSKDKSNSIFKKVFGDDCVVWNFTGKTLHIAVANDPNSLIAEKGKGELGKEKIGFEWSSRSPTIITTSRGIKDKKCYVAPFRKGDYLYLTAGFRRSDGVAGFAVVMRDDPLQKRRWYPFNSSWVDEDMVEGYVASWNDK